LLKELKSGEFSRRRAKKKKKKKKGDLPFQIYWEGGKESLCLWAPHTSLFGVAKARSIASKLHRKDDRNTRTKKNKENLKPG